METIKNAIKSGYYQLINFVQGMDVKWFVTIWLGLLALTLVCVMKFFKKYDGSQKEFVKVSLIVLAVIFFVCLVCLTYLRK